MTQPDQAPPPLIDCDIHNFVVTVADIRSYLPAHWQEITIQTDLRGPTENMRSPGSPKAGEPGTTLASLQEQVFDIAGSGYAILNCDYAVESVHHPYGAAAFASAVNDWQLDHFLTPEPRLRGSLVVPSQDVELAVQEIHRLGDRPEFVQVYLPVRSRELYGTRRFHPLYQAAVERDLAIAIHTGGASPVPPTPSGWSSYQIEDEANMAAIFQSQVMNLIVEGVFEQFPSLRVVLVASGITWLPSLMWRLDKEWKGLRREIPWVKQLPSEYIRRHIRLTLQPFDAPPQTDQLQQILTQSAATDLLMFGSDYPYCPTTTPPAWLDILPAATRRRILTENARSFYRLADPMPAAGMA